MMHGWGNEYGMGHGLGWIAMILFWVVLLTALFFIIKALAGKRGDQDARGETAEEILKKRYARGELTKEEFTEARKLIKE